MYKKIAGATLGTLLLATPLAAFAQNDASVTAQIRALLAQVQQLQAQLAQLLASHEQVTDPQTTTPRTCVNLTHSVGPDDTDADVGGDVSRLQQFLLNAGVYTGAISGHVGPATVKAVQKWQAANGLVSSGDPDSTGYGYVGPKTRDKMNCQTSPANSLPPRPKSLFTASPSSGTIPLTVTFDTKDAPSSSGSYYFLDYGDGTPLLTRFEKRTTHTYNSAGSYVATLRKCTLLQATSEKDCDVSSLVGTVTITTLNSTGSEGSCDGYLQFKSSSRSERQYYLYPMGQMVESLDSCKTKALAGFASKGGVDALIENYCSSYASERPATVTPVVEFNGSSVAIGNTTSCAGGAMPVTSAGTLSASLDSSTPSASIAAVGSNGSQGVTLGVFKFTATGESMKLNRIRLALGSDASLSAINQISIWDGSTQVGTALFAGSNASTASLSQPVTVPQNSSKTLTIKADFAGISSISAAKSGDVISVNIVGGNTQNGTRAIGVTSGSNVYLSADTGATPGLRIFKTFPTFVAPVSGTPTTLVAGSGVELYRFSVTASPAGDVGLNQVTVSIAPSLPSSALGSVSVSHVKLFAYDPSGNPAAPFVGGLVSLNTKTSVSGDTALTINQSGMNALEIPAGQTYTFRVRADVAQTAGTAGSAAAVTTKLVSDTASPAPVMASAGTLAQQEMVWSPNSQTTSTASQIDWTNGYNIPGAQPDVPYAVTVSTSGSQSQPPVSQPVQTNPVAVNSFSVSAGSVSAGQSTVFSWSSNLSSIDSAYYGGGCAITSPTVNGGFTINSSNEASSGSYSFTPSATATYTLTCSSGGKDGSPSASKQVRVNVVPPSKAFPSPAAIMSGTVTLNGVNQYVPLSGIPDSFAFSISAWVTYLGGGNCGTVFSDADATGSNDVIFGVDGNNANIRADKSGGTLFGSACGSVALVPMGLASSIANTLYHLVWVNTGSVQYLYRNGELVSSKSASGSNIGYHGSTANIGRMWDGARGAYSRGTQYFAGTIADLRYYDVALSPTQVMQLYVENNQANAFITPSTEAVSSSEIEPVRSRDTNLAGVATVNVDLLGQLLQALRGLANQLSER